MNRSGIIALALIAGVSTTVNAPLVRPGEDAGDFAHQARIFLDTAMAAAVSLTGVARAMVPR